MVFYSFKQKMADELRIRDWSADVCSSYRLLLPSTVAPERRRLSSSRQWLRILKVSGPTRRYSMKPRERQNRPAASFASSTANRISVAPLAAAQLSTVE